MWERFWFWLEQEKYPSRIKCLLCWDGISRILLTKTGRIFVRDPIWLKQEGYFVIDMNVSCGGCRFLCVRDSVFDLNIHLGSIVSCVCWFPCDVCRSLNEGEILFSPRKDFHLGSDVPVCFFLFFPPLQWTWAYPPTNSTQYPWPAEEQHGTLLVFVNLHVIYIISRSFRSLFFYTPIARSLSWPSSHHCQSHWIQAEA